MKLKRSDKAVQKIKADKRNTVEAERQATNSSQSTKEWRRSIELRLEALEDQLLNQ